MTTHDQDPEQVLAEYSHTQLQCRVDRHPWGRKAFYEQEAPRFARRYQTCPSCGTQRWKEVNIKTFEPTGRYGYSYAQGYQTPGTGLRLADFAERLYREDYAGAVKAGRVTFLDEEEAEPTPVTKLKPKKAS